MGERPENDRVSVSAFGIFRVSIFKVGDLGTTRRIDFVYHPTLGLRVIKKKVREGPWNDKSAGERLAMIAVLLFLFPGLTVQGSGFRVQDSGFGHGGREADARCRAAPVSSAPPKCNFSADAAPPHRCF